VPDTLLHSNPSVAGGPHNRTACHRRWGLWEATGYPCWLSTWRS
jgi:hypothetical protein